MSIFIRKLLAKLVIFIIHKYFSEGISNKGNYKQWSWTHEFEKSLNIKSNNYIKQINITKDGNSFCATFNDFENLQLSPAGFGDTIHEAVEDLFIEDKK